MNDSTNIIVLQRTVWRASIETQNAWNIPPILFNSVSPYYHDMEGRRFLLDFERSYCTVKKYWFCSWRRSRFSQKIISICILRCEATDIKMSSRHVACFLSETITKEVIWPVLSLITKHIQLGAIPFSELHIFISQTKLVQWLKSALQ